MKSELSFDTEITVNRTTGEVEAVYFQIRRGKVHETREYADGAAFADYAKAGELLGIEILAPCSLVIVDEVAANEPAAIKRRTRQFLQKAGPQAMIQAA